MDAKTHWETVYTSKAPEAVSWYRPHLDVSLALIERAAPDRSSALIDVGGGASTLVDDLLLRGYRNVTILDISIAAIEVSKRRIGPAAERIRWIVGDITQVDLQPSAYYLWHDRAAFHFLTARESRKAYIKQVLRAVKPGGHVIIGGFGPEGPAKCSGLKVARYDADALLHEFGPRFRMQESFAEQHQTPFGTTQQFLYCSLKVEKDPAGEI
jgi:SAM-dependent methyltransferase